MTHPVPTDKREAERRQALLASRYLLSSVASMGMAYAWNGLWIEGFGIPAEWAYPLTLALVTVQNFFVMRHWVYRSGNRPLRRQLAEFLASVLAFRGMEWVAFLVWTRALGWHWALATATNQVLFFACKYLFYQKKIFSPSPEIVP